VADSPASSSSSTRLDRCVEQGAVVVVLGHQFHTSGAPLVCCFGRQSIGSEKLHHCPLASISGRCVFPKAVQGVVVLMVRS
jgi:hypothetical protein